MTTSGPDQGNELIPKTRETDYEPSDAELVNLLEMTPGRLAACVRDAGRRAKLYSNEESWAVVDVLSHVRAADAILASRAIAVLTLPTAPLPLLDERAWGGLLERAQSAVEDQLAEFALRRAEFVRLLRSLSNEEWSLAARQQPGDAVVTVRSICRALADHELEHCAQARAEADVANELAGGDNALRPPPSANLAE